MILPDGLRLVEVRPDRWGNPNLKLRLDAGGPEHALHGIPFESVAQAETFVRGVYLCHCGTWHLPKSCAAADCGFLPVIPKCKVARASPAGQHARDRNFRRTGA
jgi:hypothetical protein